MAADFYELLDFGAGRKLERFGEIVVDRPCPAADNAVQQLPERWRHAELRYEPQLSADRRWQGSSDKLHDWTCTHRNIRFELKPTATGQVGLFPEQQPNWESIRQQVERTVSAPPSDAPPTMLNLFAYTGASTLAAAAAGASVTHVDAAKSVVAWGRRNAELSGLSAAPIRWIVDDVGKFVARELKRGRTYNAVVLDPPSYGHGPKGQTWQLERDLPGLLADCVRLTDGRLQFMLVTCHTTGVPSAWLADTLWRALQESSSNGAFGGIEQGELVLTTCNGRSLPSGIFARWHRHHD
jgi:23S rRNA (cytosine1962-C5)-methyltransferase